MSPTRTRRIGGSRTAAPRPSSSFPQREGASAKQLLMFELMRARAAVLSAVQGLTASSAGEPIAAGAWSVREILLHLITRDQARLREMEAALRGAMPSWHGITGDGWAKINAASLAPLARHDWEQTLRLLHRTRALLVEEIESVPEESEAWRPPHAFAWMMGELPPHDRHHAEQIKRWRATRGV